VPLTEPAGAGGDDQEASESPAGVDAASPGLRSKERSGNRSTLQLSLHVVICRAIGYRSDGRLPTDR